MTRALLIVSVLSLLSCKNEVYKQQESSKGEVVELKYAKGFIVTDFESHKVLEIMDPWPDADKTYRYRLVENNKQYIEHEKDDEILIRIPVNNIVVTSTTHIPGLELLGNENALIGFPGTEYISSEPIRTRIDNGLVRELGKNEGINTEVLLELNPEVVIAFGIDGNNKSYETIKNRIYRLYIMVTGPRLHHLRKLNGSNFLEYYLIRKRWPTPSSIL